MSANILQITSQAQTTNVLYLFYTVYYDFVPKKKVTNDDVVEVRSGRRSQAVRALLVLAPE